ncbi:MAG: hypothetical protein HWE13_00395 [Gammaproteobacteria bacterium]|nr:hypothetical protein [Gammaproteobacteria bacterium]NVK86546.1 hypothetical protein [Gammaproteobacteria bacterium]
MERLFNWIDKLSELSETRRGLTVITVVLEIIYGLNALLNPEGLHHPGIYAFTAVLPLGLAIALVIKNRRQWGYWVLLWLTVLLPLFDSVIRLRIA